MRWASLQVADQTAKGFVIALVATWLRGNPHAMLAVVPALSFGLAYLSTRFGDRTIASFIPDP